jgi:type IV pilus assembly protein PilY1
MVIFGTGRYLGETDFLDNSPQTIYGIWDYGDDKDDGEYLGMLDRSPVAPDTMLSNQDASVMLLEQAIVPCDPLLGTCDGDFWVVNGQNLRVLTDNISALVNPWETTSLLADNSTCGDGVNITDCEPNGYGPNPDPVYMAGWYFDLPLTGERLVSDALIRQAKVIMIAYTPEATPCGAGGNSVVMEMDGCSGGRTATAQFDINDDGIIDENDLINIGTDSDPIWVAPTGVQSEGRLQPPAILRMPDGETEMKYFSSSRGNIVTVEESAVTLGLSYWMEFY